MNIEVGDWVKFSRGRFLYIGEVERSLITTNRQTTKPELAHFMSSGDRIINKQILEVRKPNTEVLRGPQGSNDVSSR